MIRRRLDPALAARYDPEDILAGAFLQARGRWREALARGEEPSHAWLYRIVLDHLIEVWRRETRQCRDARQTTPWPEHSSALWGLGLTGSGTSPSEAVVRDDERQRVREALGRLSAEDRAVLQLRHFEQLSFPEVARVLGISESAATMRYVRALRRLKEVWERGHPQQEVDG
jgi:RNA polymerase sigma-70 factor (ECF subfamily)